MDTFHITTQHLENYGAHCESGKFEDAKSFWKFKGGTEYIVSGFDGPKAEGNAVAFVASICMQNDVSWKEFPTSWDRVESDFQTEYEVDQMAMDGKVRYPATRINVQEYFSPAVKAERMKKAQELKAHLAELNAEVSA